MTFTIDQTFDLLFGSKLPSAPISYDDRRWFRRPRPFATGDDAPREPSPAPTSDQAEADGVLEQKIKLSSRRWSVGGTPDPSSFDARRHIPPRFPYDVFAAAAHLMESAGIYHHLQPLKTSPVVGSSHGTPAATLRHIDITQADRDLVDRAAARWRSLRMNDVMLDFAENLTTGEVWKEIEPLFESWWVVFGASGSEHVMDRPETDDGPIVPGWWKHVWRLMAIADEAGAGTVYQMDMERLVSFLNGEDADLQWFEAEVFLEHLQKTLASPDRSHESSPLLEHGEFLDINSLSIANPAVVSVLPKVRTPSVGCTLRSLSHHLALLPPTGVVKGRWTPNYTRPKPQAGGMPQGVMNLVLVPLPYSLEPQSFEQVLIEDVSGGDAKEKPRFGYFDVKQEWLEDESGSSEKLLAFIDDVIASAREQSPNIHGLVFPELSLDYDTFVRVRQYLQKEVPEAELLIAGISSDREGRKGNFVAASTFPAVAGTTSDETRETVREKHHRWKLDRAQLRDYGLLGTLSPELSWWENIALQTRQVDFTVMRRDSVLAAMICEDLARVDPCQQIIRAVGPNLVVALLMDAPQVEARWPARYATVLAEDPGCAVLTLTSRALMTLQHRAGTFRSSGDDRVVAMWRDDGASKPIRLTCPYDAQAILLTIVEEDVEDVALDGRRDSDAKAWRHVGSVPLRIQNAKEKHRDILGRQDVACW